MSKGLILVAALLCFSLTSSAVLAQGAIYKVVNPDGSVTFTDQKPHPGAQPVDLKPLSVVETEKPQPVAPAAGEEAAGEGDEKKPPSRAELRRMYSDFRISQPMDEETFWGTGNEVTVSWSASTPLQDGMRVMVYVDGDAMDATNGAITLVLDRGEHEAYAVLRDASNQRVAATAPVTFFVKQHSVNFNRPNGP